MLSHSLDRLLNLKLCVVLGVLLQLHFIFFFLLCGLKQYFLCVNMVRLSVFFAFIAAPSHWWIEQFEWFVSALSEHMRSLYFFQKKDSCKSKCHKKWILTKKKQQQQPISANKKKLIWMNNNVMKWSENQGEHWKIKFHEADIWWIIE